MLQIAWTAFKLKYRETSAGVGAHCRMIQGACEEGLDWLDFGQGDADWKERWATDALEVQRVILARILHPFL